MSRFQDTNNEGGIETFVHWVDRVYQGDLRLFYSAVEMGLVPASSDAYLRFYSTSLHLNLLLPKLIKALRGRL